MQRSLGIPMHPYLKINQRKDYKFIKMIKIKKKELIYSL